MKYMKMKLAEKKLNSGDEITGFSCLSERHDGQGIQAKFLVILADDRDDEWMFDVRAFWSACDECVELLERA